MKRFLGPPFLYRRNHHTACEKQFFGVFYDGKKAFLSYVLDLLLSVFIQVGKFLNIKLQSNYQINYKGNNLLSLR